MRLAVLTVPEADRARDELSPGAKGHAAVLGNDPEFWLNELLKTRADESLFWAPHRHATAADWVKVRGVEHLAVLTSTASGGRNNVCFASGTTGFAGRTTNMIGLVQRPTLGWAVLIRSEGHPFGDVRRVGYAHDNYDAFGELSAAQISWAWVTSGDLPSGLTVRVGPR
jgi:hypothetical protein